MIEKRSYFSRALVILMALMLVFTMMPSMAFASGSGPANSASTVSTAFPQTWDNAELKWQTAVGHNSYGAYYAGNTAIEGNYIYVTGKGKIYKINKTTGAIDKSCDITAWNQDWNTDGIAIVNSKVYISNATTIKSFDLDLGNQTDVVTGQNFGLWHSILQVVEYNSNAYLWCNGTLINPSATDENNRIVKIKMSESGEETLGNTADSQTFVWSSGAVVGKYFYVSDTTNVYAIDLENLCVIDSAKYTDAAGSTSGQVVYDTTSKRIFLGTKGEQKLVSLKCDESTGKFVADSLISCDAGLSTVTAPIVSGNTIYLVGQGSNAVSVFEYNSGDTDTITKKYSLNTANTAGNGTKDVLTVQSNPVLSTADSKKVLYFSAYDGDLYAMTDNGDNGSLVQIADTPNPSGVDYPSSYEQISVDTNGNIYCYNESGYLFCYAKTDISLKSLSAEINEDEYSFTKAFYSQLQNYKLYVPKDTSSVKFTLSASEGAKIKVGESEINGTYSLTTTETETKVDFVVSKEGSTSRTYTVTVKKVDPDVKYQLSDNEPSNTDSSTLLTSKTFVGEISAANPCIWITAPENGSIVCEQADGADKVKISDTEDASKFAKKIYFENGITGQNIFKVTATSEDGSEQTYYLAASKENSYVAVDKKVYVTISNKGEIVTGNDKNKTLLANAEITVKDTDGNWVVDVDETLKTVHDTYYSGGAAAGYTTGSSTWGGTEIKKLWGVGDAYFSYYLNNNMCNGLTDTLSDGDYFKAFAYKTGYSDIYTFFENDEYTAKPNQNVTITLEQKVWDYNTSSNVTSPYAGAAVKIINANDTKTYTTDSNGNVTLKFNSTGTYTVIAETASGAATAIVPSVCKVVVSDTASTPVISNNSSVRFILMGDSVHNDKTTHTLKNGGLQTWISKNVTITSTNNTVGYVFQTALASGNSSTYTYKGLENNYISSITKDGVELAQFTNGQKSGWMYTVNGKHPVSLVNDYTLSDGDVVIFHYTDDYTVEQGSEEWSAAADATTTQTVTTTGTTGAATTTSPADVKVTEQTGTDGSKEKVAEVTVSAANQKEILSQAKTNKSAEIVLNASSDSAKDASKVNVKLDKSFVNSIVSDTDAKLTVKTPLGDKTYTQDELKTLAAAATGTTVTLTIEKADSQVDTEDELDVKAEVAKLTPVARSSKTAKKYIKVTTSLDKNDKAIIAELKDAGYTVKYRFYRSTKKASSYKAKLTGTTGKYTNTAGKSGTRYYYKVQLRVYDKDGNFVAKTAIKQCKYATRIFGK